MTNALDRLKWPARIRRHWPAAVIAALAALLLFTHLGRDYLWEDEGDTAVLASNALSHGVPVAWDGTTFIDPDYGQRLTDRFVMVSHPWLQYYAAASSFALFGESVWAARLPFALAGLFTVLLVYALAFRVTGTRRAAISTAVLLMLNVQFLLFSRQARNYSLHALLTCLLVWQFVNLRTWRQGLVFAITGALLFHAHPIGLAAIAALALLALVGEPASDRRRIALVGSAVVGVYALPWIAASRAGYAANTAGVADWALVVPRLLQFGAEWISVAPLVGIVVLYVAARAVRRAEAPLRGSSKAARVFSGDERVLVAACAAVAAAEAAVMAATQNGDDLWIIGLHHTPELIPLALIVAGLLITKVSGRNRAVWLALMLVFGFTRISRTAMITLLMQPHAARVPDAVATLHVPASFSAKVFRPEQIRFVQSLGEPNPGSIERLSAFLHAHAGPDDVVITNYAWETLYFHTRLPQAAKISPAFPIYKPARAAGLPAYVFGAGEAKWIVWRRAWPAFFPGQDIPALLRSVRAAGMEPRLVASVPETTYENRENVHFHRFARGHYVFPGYGPAPDALVFHVESLDEAIVSYRADLESRPDDLRLVTDAAFALGTAGRSDDAVRLFTHALDLDPASEDAERGLASLLFDRADVAGAERHALRAVTLNPDDAFAHDVLGLTLAVQHDLRGAQREFVRALELTPQDGEVRDHLARVQALLAP